MARSYTIKPRDELTWYLLLCNGTRLICGSYKEATQEGDKYVNG